MTTSTGIIQLDALFVSVAGVFIMILLAIIAVFLQRLLKQFDGLTGQVVKLNETMVKIDKDLSGDVSLLKQENLVLKKELKDIWPLWDRVRAAELCLEKIKSGGCEVKTDCKGGCQ